MPKGKTKNRDTGANLDFEAKPWSAADALRNNMDAAEYKHVVLGLIFLKYISDAFEAKQSSLFEADQGDLPLEGYAPFGYSGRPIPACVLRA